MPAAWLPAEPDLANVHSHYADPLRALANAEIPAIILRDVYAREACAGLLQRFQGWGLIREPHTWKRRAQNSWSRRFQEWGGRRLRGWRLTRDPLVFSNADHRRRIDIGTSLAQRGADKEAFLAHAAHTHELFSVLFQGFADPVETFYAALSALANDKAVKTAREPDGRLYGPAIFRTHYATHSYIPHIDSVRYRENRTNYAVYRFTHQFAGILCLQNAKHGERSAQTIIHNCVWTPAIQSYLDNGTFPQYAQAHNIGQYRVDLAPGDLYFFNTLCIHEIPPLDGDNPRAVLAAFIGYSPDDPEIYVWS